jgi:hypothetical protein
MLARAEHDLKSRLSSPLENGCSHAVVDDCFTVCLISIDVNLPKILRGGAAAIDDGGTHLERDVINKPWNMKNQKITKLTVSLGRVANNRIM